MGSSLQSSLFYEINIYLFIKHLINYYFINNFLNYSSITPRVIISLSLILFSSNVLCLFNFFPFTRK